MKKLYIALIGGVISLAYVTLTAGSPSSSGSNLIAQTPEEEAQAFDLGAQANVQGPDAFVGADVEERKKAAEMKVQQEQLQQFHEKLAREAQERAPK